MSTGIRAQDNTDHMKQGYDIESHHTWKTIIVKTLEDIENIRSIWEQMQRDESIPVLNADVDRYLAVVETMKDAVQPYVIVLYCDGNPKVMAIGRIETRRITCRIGYATILKPSLRCLSVVYGGILGQPSNEMNTVLLRELLDSLKRGEADVIFFNHLRIDSHLYHLAATTPNFWCKDHSSVVEDHWQTHVPETAEDFYASIRRKRKKEWKRLSRRLGESAGGSLKVECYDNINQVEHFIEVASKMSAMTYKKALNVGFNISSQTRSTLTRAAKRNRWRAYVLYAGQVPCAFETGIVYERVYFAEAIGYSPEWSNFSPGTILFVKVLEDLSQNTPVKIFDYGFGSAGYKERFGTDFWPEASVYIFAPRLYPVIINVLRSSVNSANAGLQYVVQKIGSLGWNKRQWRNLLQAKNPDSKCGVGR
jgi:CelD/BcsL family acetyltransferase involved in cellulose biosynthesis